MSGRRILIDTSVWIEYFRNKSDALSKQVDAILSYDEVVVPKVVIAELVQGARSEKEISVVEGFVGAFNVVDHKEGTWERAGRISYGIKKKGRQANLADCYIAVIARDNQCHILTLDQHFKDIKDMAGIKLLGFHGDQLSKK
jgi:predicted nucleic acid-binding protein